MNTNNAQQPNKATRTYVPSIPQDRKDGQQLIYLDPASKAIFDKAYEKANIELAFKGEWSNGTGMYDYVVYGAHAPVVPIGQMARSSTPGGRKLIIIGSRLGNIVVFERHVVAKKKVMNVTYAVQATSNVMQGGWFSHLVLDDYEMSLAVGEEDGYNIGRRIDALWTSMKRA